MFECTEATPLLMMGVASALLLIAFAVGRWAQREMDRLERLASELRSDGANNE